MIDDADRFGLAVVLVIAIKLLGIDPVAAGGTMISSLTADYVESATVTAGSAAGWGGSLGPFAPWIAATSALASVWLVTRYLEVHRG